MFDLWNDTEYLYNFFEDNKEFLKDSYWSDTSLSNIVTGGAIKLTQEMKDHEATNKELKKLELCKNFLIENNITDIEQIEVIL